MSYVPKPLTRTADASRGRRSPGDWARGIASVLAIGVAVYLGLGLTAELVARNIPDEWEAMLFAWTQAPGSEQHTGDDAVDGGTGADRTPVVAHGAEVKARAVFERLVAEPGHRELPYRFAVLDMKTPNAFAAPGGSVVVTSGLLDEVRGETGLAFVIAHELGHHKYRHTLRRLGRGILIQTARLAIGADVSILDSGAALAELSHSRTHENEADAFAIDLVVRTYGTSNGALEFLELMEPEDSNVGSFAAMLRTHPVTQGRLDALRAHIRETEASLP